MASGSAGSNPVAQLLLLLAIVGGAGGWNYHQNLEAEKRVYRPYRGYSEADLQTLEDAYSGHTDLTNERYQKTVSKRADARSMPLIGEQVREFERVQGIARQKRDARDRLADSQANLALVEAENRLRAKERDALKLFFRRVFTVNR
jgi:hypothetical protein